VITFPAKGKKRKRNEESLPPLRPKSLTKGKKAVPPRAVRERGGRKKDGVSHQKEEVSSKQEKKGRRGSSMAIGKKGGGKFSSPVRKQDDSTRR